MIILSPIFNFSALDIPRKNGEILFKFHSSLRLRLLFAFLGSFRFLSSVDGKEKDNSLKLYLSFGTTCTQGAAQIQYPMVVYRIHTFLYVEESKWNFV